VVFVSMFLHRPATMPRKKRSKLNEAHASQKSATFKSPETPAALPGSSAASTSLSQHSSGAKKDSAVRTRSQDRRATNLPGFVPIDVEAWTQGAHGMSQDVMQVEDPGNF
jgi:hypothetical protein